MRFSKTEIMETTDNTSSADSLRRAAIDRSVKGPVLFLYANAAMWLLASTVLGLIASIKIYAPGFLDKDWLFFLNYARVQPAHIDTLVYGWAMQAGMGTMIWLMARRSGQELRKGAGSIITATIFWNVALTLGIVSILAGESTSMQLLEFPRFVWPIFLISFVMISVRLVGLYARAGKEEGFMITSWYILGACFWFPWIFFTTNLLLHCFGSSLNGAFAAGIDAWYVSTLILLFFAPVGLGACYYFIPKITGQPIYSSQLASIAFWGLAALGGWTGMQKYNGGPISAWMPAVGGAAMILLLVPAGIVAWNFHLSAKGQHGKIQTSPTLRFVFVGSFSFFVMSGVGALIGTFWTGSMMQFTHAEYGYQILAVYGFFSMTMFGAIYYIVPRLSGCEWLSARLIRNHFWFSVYGISALIVCMLLGGLAQGSSINNPENWDGSFVGSIQNARGYLIGRTVAWVFILWSNGWFFLHLVLMVLGLGRRSVAPTLLHRDEEHAAA